MTGATAEIVARATDRRERVADIVGPVWAAGLTCLPHDVCNVLAQAGPALRRRLGTVVGSRLGIDARELQGVAGLLPATRVGLVEAARRVGLAAALARHSPVVPQSTYLAWVDRFGGGAVAFAVRHRRTAAGLPCVDLDARSVRVVGASLLVGALWTMSHPAAPVVGLALIGNRSPVPTGAISPDLEAMVLAAVAEGREAHG